MNYRDESRQPYAPVKPRRRWLPYINLVLLMAFGIGFCLLNSRVDQEEITKMRLVLELGETQQNISELETVSARRLDAIRSEAARMRADADQHVAGYAQRVDAVLLRLANLESGNRKDRAKAVASLRGELATLQKNFQTQLATRTPKRLTQQEVFCEFEQKHGQGIVLIYTEFDYERRISGKIIDTKTVSGWGSGFFATNDGHIVTNKHVIEPWKFDSDLTAMEALGEIRVLRDSIRIGCWPAGTKFLDDDGSPSWSTGFNNHRTKNLRVFATANDNLTEHTIEIGSSSTTYETHGLNNNDLAILQANGAGIRSLPLSTSRPLSKLDPIMVVGFPRGKNGLERGAAESSASIGCVRKVENTIHVTASIIPGNSGGPLIGPKGEVVGIVTRIYSETLGICIKLQHATDLIENGRRAERAIISANIR